MKITKKQAEKRAEKQVLTGLVLKKFETDEEFKNKLLFAVNVFFQRVIWQTMHFKILIY